MPSDVFEPFDQDVDAHGGYQYALATRRSSLHANRRFSEVIIETARLDGKRVVDVGCGDGTYTAVLRAETRADSILGIDPAGKAIQLANYTHAQKQTRLAFRHCFASDLVATGEHFDVAIYRGVIHHVGDPAGEIATALRLADRALFLEPNGTNPVVKAIERFSSYHRSHSERSYPLWTYRRWIQEARGEIRRSFYFGLVPMFCPDWLVAVGSALEPAVERLPGIRALLCGQILILATAGM